MKLSRVYKYSWTAALSVVTIAAAVVIGTVVIILFPGMIPGADSPIANRRFPVSLSDYAWAGQNDPLRGRPFSDPSKVFHMSDEWVKQPVKYESWAEGAELAVVLDQQLYPAILPLIQEFGHKYGIKIAAIEGTCGTAAGAALRKTADITGMCCAPGETDRLPGLKYHTVGIASVAIIVRKDNPANGISLDDARKMFMGKLTNWAKVKTTGFPSPDVQVKPVVRLHCKSRPGHWCLLLANADLFSTRVIEVSTIEDMLEQVSVIKGSVGYETMWMVGRFRSAGRLKALKIDGVAPGDNENLVKGKYTIYRTFNITSWDGRGVGKKKAGELVGYILANLDRVDPAFGIVTAAGLKKYGWKFNGSEVVGEPD
ncbi:MAG: substrate-binding domain-containing protein [Nitrospirae bacterium]|nr:substrate-binding domain-containing protein [Nitrospirota bacterium]